MRRRLQELKGDKGDDPAPKGGDERGRPSEDDEPDRSAGSGSHLPPAYWFEDDPAGDHILPLEPQELLVHALPEGPRERKGPFGASAALHTLLVVLLILSRWWMPAPAPEKPSELTIALQATPQSEDGAKSKPRTPPPQALQTQPKPQEPPAQRKAVPPPAVPKEIPPPTPLPPPKRMGELVPIPHLPVPGTVPPEETKTGKPGAPGPKVDQQVPPAGSPDGDNEKDAGAGDRTGPGAAGEGESPNQGMGAIQGGTIGGIPVPKVGGGSTGQPGNAGGGRRKGLNMQLPPDSGAFGDFSFEDKDYDWNDYYSQMYWSIWRAWHNRLYVMLPIFERWSFQKRSQRLKGTVLIRFVIDRSGTVSSIDVLEPSSISPLDDSAVTALKEVILPRLPDDFAKDHEAVTGRFILDIDSVPDFRQGITYYKSRGIF